MSLASTQLKNNPGETPPPKTPSRKFWPFIRRYSGIAALALAAVVLIAAATGRLDGDSGIGNEPHIHSEYADDIHNHPTETGAKQTVKQEVTTVILGLPPALTPTETALPIRIPTPSFCLPRTLTLKMLLLPTRIPDLRATARRTATPAWRRALTLIQKMLPDPISMRALLLIHTPTASFRPIHTLTLKVLLLPIRIETPHP